MIVRERLNSFNHDREGASELEARIRYSDTVMVAVKDPMAHEGATRNSEKT